MYIPRADHFLPFFFFSEKKHISSLFVVVDACLYHAQAIDDQSIDFNSINFNFNFFNREGNLSPTPPSFKIILLSQLETDTRTRRSANALIESANLPIN